MVAGDDYVFVAVPRTASVAIGQHWLLDYYGGITLPRGHHRREVPEEYSSKLVWAVVRDPYERMLSLWRLFYLRRGRPPFEQFLEHCLTSPRKVFMNQVRFLELAEPSRVVRFEQLEDGLAVLPFVKEWHPVEYRNTHDHPDPPGRLKFPLPLEHVWTKAERELVEQHSGDDFDAYGYTVTE